MKKFTSVLLDLMAADASAVMLDADLSRSSGSGPVKDRWPDRFLNTGIAEQNTMGVAAGLALAGLRPLVHTFAAFATMRACEQVRTAIAYQKLNVTICASKAGLAAASSGPTHHALEDLAIMRSIPGMTVVAPSDFQELAYLLPDLVRHEGPVYVRVPPEDAPVLPSAGPSLGQADREEASAPVTLVTTGILGERAHRTGELLESMGIATHVLHVPFVKPLDRRPILSRIARARLVVTIEEHSVIGGLGSAVAELIAEEGGPPLWRVGVDDVFCYASGTHNELISDFVLTPEELATRIRNRISTW
ncbi:transketolase family protein [Streptomyces sp. NPDC014764]|uniref:transketolase family protein n=1 Tax=Streptomyces sp. NPDC014764 TaxID=3364907 RepID=UPI0036FBE25E